MPSIHIDFERPLTNELLAIYQALEKIPNAFRMTHIQEKEVNLHAVQTSLTFKDDPRSSLPPFPETLRSLTILNCPNLTSLPNFPESIVDLHIKDTPITCLPCDTCSLKYLCLINTGIQVLPDMKGLPRLECSDNPFTDIQTRYSDSVGDWDWNQTEDFFCYYEPKAAIVRQKLKEGIPFDVIVRESLAAEKEEKKKAAEERARLIEMGIIKPVKVGPKKK